MGANDGASAPPPQGYPGASGAAGFSAAEPKGPVPGHPVNQQPYPQQPQGYPGYPQQQQQQQQGGFYQAPPQGGGQPYNNNYQQQQQGPGYHHTPYNHVGQQGPYNRPPGGPGAGPYPGPPGQQQPTSSRSVLCNIQTALFICGFFLPLLWFVGGLLPGCRTPRPGERLFHSLNCVMGCIVCAAIILGVIFGRRRHNNICYDSRGRAYYC